MLGVTSSATTTVKYNSGVKAKNGAITATTYNGLTLTAASTGFTIAGGTTSKTLTVNNTYTLGAACAYGVDDATANGALSTGTGLTTERSVYYGLVTVNNASQTRATGIYAPTSAGTANQILVSAGDTSAPTWKATSSGAAYATSSNGALTFGTLPIAQGGTGTNTAPTQWGIIYASSTTAYASTGAGTAGYLLQSNATSAPSWIQATDANTGSTIVKRDASGNFSAGTITASLSGNATTATKATQDGSGNTITSYYCTLSTDQTISGAKTFTGNLQWGASGVGGRLNGSATNGGMNSILVGDDTWLGDCNVGGRIAVKANNAASAGFQFYGSDGTHRGNLYYDGTGHSSVGFYGAVWNDYAEFRKSDTIEPGYVICPFDNGIAYKSTQRLQPGGRIISDTFGFVVGECDDAKTPVGLAGRVLAYTYRDRKNYKIGDVVCAAPGGTVDRMTRKEIIMYPDRIIGIVNEIPEYEIWESTLTSESAGTEVTQKVKINGRIWIDIK